MALPPTSGSDDNTPSGTCTRYPTPFTSSTTLLLFASIRATVPLRCAIIQYSSCESRVESRQWRRASPYSRLWTLDSRLRSIDHLVQRVFDETLGAGALEVGQ